MMEGPAIVAAAGWHGIGTLSPDARIAALAFAAILVLLGIGLAGWHRNPTTDRSPDAPPRK